MQSKGHRAPLASTLQPGCRDTVATQVQVTSDRIHRGQERTQHESSRGLSRVTWRWGDGGGGGSQGGGEKP